MGGPSGGGAQHAALCAMHGAHAAGASSSLGGPGWWAGAADGRGAGMAGPGQEESARLAQPSGEGRGPALLAAATATLGADAGRLGQRREEEDEKEAARPEEGEKQNAPEAKRKQEEENDDGGARNKKIPKRR